MDCRQCLDQKIDSNLAIRWPIQCLDLVDNKLDIANMCQLYSVASKSMANPVAESEN